MKKQQLPPPVLIQTWIKLIRSNESQAVRDNAKNNLLDVFGSVERIVDYIKEHSIDHDN